MWGARWRRMKTKFRVPAPPGYEPAPGREFVQPKRKKPRRRRQGLSGCTTGLLAVLILVLATLAIGLCGMVVGGPSLLSVGNGGRTNVLLLGIDRRGGTGWTYRTDTIVVVTADPVHRTAGMLSIPRDLQLTIPTVGDDRINTANVYGYLRNYPGGGPALLEATIQTNFGIPIDRYVMVDFTTFTAIVDALGGIDVDVPKALTDTKYPDPKPGDPYAYKTVHFDPGLQHMNGKRALVYARSRMSTSDFDRAMRQQLILIAIRHKALSLAGIPRWPALAAILTSGLKTDMSPGDMIALGFLAVEIGPSNLEQVVLQHPLVSSYRRADGAAVQLPNWDLINPVIDELFGD
jgi:LCP family protein required for cell wall assembly